MRSLFPIDIGLSPEYKDWIDDLLKFFTFSFVTHILAVFANDGTFFSENWMKSTVFLLLGLSAYHLVVKKIINIVFDDNAPCGFADVLRLWQE